MRRTGVGDSVSTTPFIQAFFDEATNSVSYLIGDHGAGEGAIIDPVLGFDSVSGAIDHQAADAMLEAAEREGLTIRWLLETHAHADHLSAAHYLQ